VLRAGRLSRREIEAIALPTAGVDAKVLRETARVLKPGGRFAA
jgi:hypothetical protein